MKLNSNNMLVFKVKLFVFFNALISGTSILLVLVEKYTESRDLNVKDKSSNLNLTHKRHCYGQALYHKDFLYNFSVYII